MSSFYCYTIATNARKLKHAAKLPNVIEFKSDTKSDLEILWRSFYILGKTQDKLGGAEDSKRPYLEASLAQLVCLLLNRSEKYYCRLRVRTTLCCGVYIKILIFAQRQFGSYHNVGFVFLFSLELIPSLTNQALTLELPGFLHPIGHLSNSSVPNRQSMFMATPHLFLHLQPRPSLISIYTSLYKLTGFLSGM